MNQMFNNFNRAADINITDALSRSKIIAAALALAISNLSAVPSSELQSPESYFNLQILPQVKVIVSRWNENLVFDARSCCDQTRSFWMLRYTAAHPISRPQYITDSSFFEANSGVGTFISPEAQSFLNTHKRAILFLATQAAEVVLSMQEGSIDV